MYEKKKYLRFYGNETNCVNNLGNKCIVKFLSLICCIKKNINKRIHDITKQNYHFAHFGLYF